MPLSGIAIAEIGVGGVLVYSGVKGATLANTFQSLLKGTTPSASQTISTTSAATPATTTTAATTAAAAVDAAAASSVTAPSVSGTYSTAQLEQLWESAGGDSDTAAFAAAVAMAESSGNASITSQNPDGGTNVGLWQLDTKGVGSGYTVAELQNPETNAKITVLATHNGTDWSEWGDPVTAAVGYTYSPGEAVP